MKNILKIIVGFILVTFLFSCKSVNKVADSKSDDENVSDKKVYDASSDDWATEALPLELTDKVGSDWVLQENLSDDFNYEFAPSTTETTFGEHNQWVNRYHNEWTGNPPTQWEFENSSVTNGKLVIKANRDDGETCEVNGKTVPKTHLGCISSVDTVTYPAYVEANVKLCAGQFASDVWMLTPDNEDQEIDIVEGYGAEQFGWFESIHLSHHVFIRSPWADYQPYVENVSFYKGDAKFGTADINWRDEYHTVGVYWEDPWHLYYYIDGNLVHTTTKDMIDPKGYTNGTGLNKPENIIINMEHQSWLATNKNAEGGYNTSDEELKLEENSTFHVNWIRVYKPGK